MQNLNSLTIYQIKLKTICQSDVSDSSEIVAVQTSDEVEVPPIENDCAVPLGIEIDFVDESSAMVSWENNIDANLYLVNLYDAPNENAVVFQTGSFNPFVQLTNLTEGTTYWLRVKSNCGNQSSDFGQWLSFTTLGDLENCASPNNLFAAFETETSIELNWAPLANATAYNVQVNESSTNLTSNYLVGTNSLELLELNSCSAYTFKVQALCNNNLSDYSALANFMTLCPPVSQPDGVCDAQAQSIQMGYINQIKIGGTTNLSGNNDGYGDYQNIEININDTGSNIFILNSNNPNQQYYWGIWIDGNNDGNFDFENEKLYSSSEAKSGTVGGFIHLGENEYQSNVLLRIIMSKTPITDPCADIEFGEIEDYTVIIE